MTPESVNNSIDAAESSQRGGNVSATNLQKLVREFEAFDQSPEGKRQLEKFTKSIKDGSDIPSDLQGAFEKYALKSIKENPVRYGLPAGGSDAERTTQAKEFLTQNKAKLSQLLRTNPAWQAGVKEHNTQALITEMGEDFSISSGEQEKVRKDLEKKHPLFLKGLLGSTGKRRIYLEGLLKRKFDSVNLGSFAKTIEELHNKHAKSSDSRIQMAIQELERLARNESNIDPTKLGPLFSGGDISESDIKTILSRLLPTVSLRELSNVSPEAFEKLYQQLHSKIGANYGIEKGQARELLETRIGNTPISTRGLSADLQRQILQGVGGKRIIESVQNNISPDGFSFPEGIEEFNGFYEDSVLDTGSSNAYEALTESYGQKQSRPEVDDPGDLEDRAQPVIPRRGTKEKLISGLSTWGKRYGTISDIEKFEEGSIIKATKVVKGKSVDFFYKVVALPEKEVTEDTDGHPSTHLCQLQFLGTNTDGILANSGADISKNTRELFFFFTREVDSVSFLKANEWEKYQEDEEIEEHTEFGPYSAFDHDRFEEKVGEIIGNSNVKINEGSSFSLKGNDGAQTYVYIKEYDPKTGDIILDQGFEDEGGDRFLPFTFGQFLSFSQNASGMKYHGATEPTCTSVLAELSMDGDTKSVFSGLSFENGAFYSGDPSNKDERKHIEVIRASGDKKDIFIHGIHGNEVEISMGMFTPHVMPDGATGQEFKNPKYAEVNGSRQKIHIQAFLTYFKHHKPKQANYIIKEYQPEEEITEGKAGFLSGILALKRLGAIPFAFKKPFEAIKAEWERDMEVFGNQAAYLFLEKVPIIKYFDWNTTLMANTSRSIKSQLEQAVEEVGGAYSSRRQDIIYKWGTKHKMPHFKFIAAMMATLSEYGGFYYAANAKRLGPYFWVQKILYPGAKPRSDWPSESELKSRRLQGLLKQAASLPNDAPDITLDEFASINEIHMTQIAFVMVQKKYPQYSNFYRMTDKFVHKGHEGGVGGGPPNLASRPDKAGRLAWLMEGVAAERINERIPAIKELWFKDQVGYEGYEYGLPIYALITSNRLPAAPKETIDLLKDMGRKEGIHIPAFFFLEDARELITLRKAMVQIAYIIGPEAGKIMEDLIKGTESRPARGKEGKAHAETMTEFWRDYGKEFTNLMGATKNPAAMALHLADQAAIGSDPNPKTDLEKFGNLDSSYREAFHKYFDTMTKKLDIESTMTYRGTSYDQDFFRFSHDIGFPVFFLSDCYTYFDKNVNNKPYWMGDDPYAGDGIWNEFRKAVQNIPQGAMQMVEKYEQTTGKNLSASEKKKMHAKYTYAMYQRVRHGPTGQSGAYAWLKGQERFSLKAHYWSNDALIYGFIGPKDNDTNEENILEKFEEWRELHNLYGKEGKYRLGDEGKGEMVNGEVVNKNKEAVGSTVMTKKRETSQEVQGILSGDTRSQIRDILGEERSDARSSTTMKTGVSGHVVDRDKLEKVGNHNYLRILLGEKPKKMVAGEMRNTTEQELLNESRQSQIRREEENTVDEETGAQD